MIQGLPSGSRQYVSNHLTTDTGDFDGGTRAVDDALAELDRREAEQSDTARRSRVALLEVGVEQDILRRDAVRIARRIEAIVAAEQPTDRPTWAAQFRERRDRFFREGEEKGVNFSLTIAVELARRMALAAHDGDERGTAANLLGNGLDMFRSPRPYRALRPYSQTDPHFRQRGRARYRGPSPPALSAVGVRP
jgi:hypothetical protein